MFDDQRLSYGLLYGAYKGFGTDATWRIGTSVDYPDPRTLTSDQLESWGVPVDVATRLLEVAEYLNEPVAPAVQDQTSPRLVVIIGNEREFLPDGFDAQWSDIVVTGRLQFPLDNVAHLVVAPTGTVGQNVLVASEPLVHGAIDEDRVMRIKGLA